MTWEDRLRDAAYTGPDGTRLVFLFEDVSKVIRKKTPAHDFPDVNSTFVEDLGLRGAQYPLRVIFSGPDHDLEAAAFEALIVQRGPGVLEHPMYGRRDVIPRGDITRNDALKTAANQTIFQVTFWETILAIYPDPNDATVQSVDDAQAAFNETNAAHWETVLEIQAPDDEASFLQTMQALKDGALGPLRAASDATAALTRKIDSISRAIDSTLADFIGGPQILASQIQRLLNAPSRAASLLRTRLDQLKGMVESLVNGTGTNEDSGGGTGTSATGPGVVDPGVGAPGAAANASNLFHANSLMAEGTIAAIASAVSGETYVTRLQAIQSAVELVETFDGYVAWADSNYEVLSTASPGPDPTRPNSTGPGAIDTGETYQALQFVVVQTAKYLISVSFELATERVLILDAPRTALDLVAELYGGLERFDEFVESNDFTGDELIEIPRGAEVRYHV